MMQSDILTPAKKPYIQNIQSTAIKALSKKDLTKQVDARLTVHLTKAPDKVELNPECFLMGVNQKIPVDILNTAEFEAMWCFNFDIDSNLPGIDTFTMTSTGPMNLTSEPVNYFSPVPPQVDLILSGDVKTDIKTVLPDPSGDSFVWVKFDIFAMRNGEWSLADPRVGVKRGG